MYEKVNPFDTNNKERIYNLLRLKGESLIKGHTLALKRNTDASGHYSNFFSAISDQIDLLLIYFLNDEISASLHERGPIKELIKEILEDHYSKSDLKELQVAQDDLFDLFVNRTDFIIGSNFLDFKISTYSTFEKYVVELYEAQILKTPRSNKKEKDLIKHMEQYSRVNSQEEKERILDKVKKINFYTSSAEKINYVLSKCMLDKEERSQINDFISFYRDQRNTIHNLGVHKGESKSIQVDSFNLILDKGKPSNTDNWNSAISACRQLMGVYTLFLSKIEGIHII